MEELKGVGLNPNTHIHLTDHLAPLCVLLDIPLLLTDEKHEADVHSLYPGIKTILAEWEEINPHYLIENFDLFFQSEPWDRVRFYNLFRPLEQMYHKNVRNVHCPHGFSDKRFWLKQCAYEDITLVYGAHMLDMFKEEGVFSDLNIYVRTGNYRYFYYRQHQAFFDELINQKIFSQFSQKRPVILYAPTCRDQEETTSFFDANPIFENLPSDYNLVVKIHPQLEDTDAPRLYRLMGQYENKGQILFVKDLPLVYPILAKSDIYIGDMSSIGYDFLAFNRPMFFLNQIEKGTQADRHLYLYRCGVEIKPDQYSSIYEVIASHLKQEAQWKKIREQVYHYTFGEDVPPQELKDALKSAYFAPKKGYYL